MVGFRSPSVGRPFAVRWSSVRRPFAHVGFYQPTSGPDFRRTWLVSFGRPVESVGRPFVSVGHPFVSVRPPFALRWSRVGSYQPTSGPNFRRKWLVSVGRPLVVRWFPFALRWSTLVPTNRPLALSSLESP